VDAHGHVLFARRREGGLFGGLWEPPMVEGISSPAAARPALAEIGVRLGPGGLEETGEVKHVLTHRRMRVVVAKGSRPGRPRPSNDLAAPYERSAWRDPERPGFGVSTLARKILARAGVVTPSDEKD
jgi:A/G-specific adenine glycosylase